MATADAHGHPDPTETDTHAVDTGDGHGHGASSEPLGPIDRRAWAAAIGGGALGIVVIVALYLSLQA
jgi:hypothetical protein